MKTLLTILLAAALAAPIQFDKTVHDFGEISTKAGKQTCTFTVTNDADEDLSILAVVPSCGCTDVVWTREAIAPGAKGEIKATYSNDEGKQQLYRRQHTHPRRRTARTPSSGYVHRPTRQR